MRQFFALRHLDMGDTYEFDDRQSHHIRDVLRMREGDVVRIVTDEGKALLGKLSFSGDGVSALITDQAEGSDEREIICAAAMIKKDK